MSSFLLVRLGALGDIVHAIPVAAALRRAFPSARIDWLVSAKHREILDLVPVVNRRIVVNQGLHLLSAVAELRKSRYEIAFDLQGLIKSAMIARTIGAGRVVGFSRKYLREPFASVFYTDSHDPGGEGIYARSETRHVVEINLGLLQAIGLSVAQPEFPFDAMQYLAVAGEAAWLRAADLERFLLDAGDRTRWGGGWTPVATRVDVTSTESLVRDGSDFRAATADELSDATLTLGPGAMGGFLRIEFSATRTPVGPSVGPLVAAAFAYADAAHGTGIGAVAPAEPAR